MQNALNNALLYTAAQFNVDDILTRDVAGFREAVQQRVGDLVEQEQLGIVIDQCEVQSIPPRQLQDVFAQVTTARENRNKALLDAHSYENQVSEPVRRAGHLHHQRRPSPSARATSSPSPPRRSDSATCCRNTSSNPDLFVQMTFVQAMEQVLTNVQDKIYLPQRADGKPRELRLQLNREPPQPKPAASP